MYIVTMNHTHKLTHKWKPLNVCTCVHCFSLCVLVYVCGFNVHGDNIYVLPLKEPRGSFSSLIM